MSTDNPFKMIVDHFLPYQRKNCINTLNKEIKSLSVRFMKSFITLKRVVLTVDVVYYLYRKVRLLHAGRILTV